MLRKGDKDVLGSLRGYDAYICFKETEDAFAIISLEPPDAVQFMTTKHQGRLEKPGVVFLNGYKNGVGEQTQMWFGKWSKAPLAASADASFTTLSGSSHAAYITNSEITLSFTYTNQAKSQTDNTIQVRRSTLRFVESYSWPPADKKDPGGIKENGRCSEMNLPNQ